MDFGELKNDSNFVDKVKAVSETVARINDAIKSLASVKSEELSTAERVKLDIFLEYAVNSLFFMHLKIEGENTSTVSRPTKHQRHLIYLSLAWNPRRVEPSEGGDPKTERHPRP
jgi:hypothetical protein